MLVDLVCLFLFVMSLHFVPRYSSEILNARFGSRSELALFSLPTVAALPCSETLCACVPNIITTFPNPPPDITGVSIKARLVRDTLLKYSCYQSRPFDTRA